MTNILEQVLRLSVEERIVLVERIWDNIAEDSKTQDLDISEELETELARRIALLHNNQTQLYSWDEVKQDIFKEYRKSA